LGNQSGAAMTRPGDVDHVEVVLRDYPVQVSVVEIQTGTMASPSTISYPTTSSTTTCSIGHVGLAEGSRAIWPLFLALVLVKVILILFPSISTLVPDLFF
jgi:TRAP-type C4-dicarboxylate transport system permease large subunit